MVAVFYRKLAMSESIGDSWVWAHMERRPPEQFDLGFIHVKRLRKR
jgi:hypothetical protein